MYQTSPLPVGEGARRASEGDVTKEPFADRSALTPTLSQREREQGPPL